MQQNRDSKGLEILTLYFFSKIHCQRVDIYIYTHTYSNVCLFYPGFAAPAASLHARHTHTRLIRRSPYAGALTHPTHVACCTQATHVTRVSTSGPIARSPNQENCHSAIGADPLKLRNYELRITLFITFFYLK